MRNFLIPPVLLLIVFAACTTTLPTASLEDAYFVRVECQGDVNSRQMVLLCLRQGRAKDMHEDNNGNVLVIETAYYKSETSEGVMQKIADDLRRMPVVLSVDVAENRSVIHQSP
ncbi:hypothetical protein [Puia dinghuensis]|nr:hypothetical protein [Puia dinghuensis]